MELRIMTLYVIENDNLRHYAPYPTEAIAFTVAIGSDVIGQVTHGDPIPITAYAQFNRSPNRKRSPTVT